MMNKVDKLLDRLQNQIDVLEGVLEGLAITKKELAAEIPRDEEIPMVRVRS